MNFSTHVRLCATCLAVVLLVYVPVLAQRPSYRLDVSHEQYEPLAGATPVAMQWWDRPLLKTNPHFPIDIGTETFSFFGTAFALDATNRIGISPYGEIKLENEEYYIDIYAFFTELDSTRPNTQVAYKVEGTPGDRILKVEWSEVGFPNCPTTAFANFQLWVYQRTGVFEVRYGPRVVDVGCEGIFIGNGGPFVAIFRGVQNTPYVDGLIFLYGNPDAPLIEQNGFPPLTGAPKENTKYTFTPTGVSSSVGEAVDTPHYSVYPNPVAENLSYSLPEAAQAHMRIVDVAGRTLLEDDDVPGTGEIAVERLQPGTYFLELRAHGRRTVVKFVKL